MRKLYTTIAVALVAATAWAQSVPTRLRVELRDGSSQTFTIDDIADIVFETPAPTPSATQYWEVAVPTDFSQSYVLDILDAQGKKVGEACSEYVRSRRTDGQYNADGTATVVYAAGSDGRALLADCYDITHNARLAWAQEGDSIATYTALTGAAPATLYLSSLGEVLAELPAGATAQTATVSPYTIQDKRSALEKNSYPVVKIGVQYWMACNLKTRYYADGTAITNYKSTQLDAWKATTGGACHLYGDDSQSQTLYGVMYNGYALASAAGLAPDGWEIPETADYVSLRGYVKTGVAAKLKSTGAYDWTDGGDAKYTPTDLTHFGASADGYFSPATSGDAGYGTDLYLWTRTVTTEFKKDNYGAMRLYYKNTGLITTGYHAPNFGHYVRCIRK